MKTFMFILLVFTVSSGIIFPQGKDSLKTYNLKEIKVFGKKYLLDRNEFPVEKDNLTDVLELGGFSIIRKGVFLAQDVYSEGLKRGDYTIVVDGERYHNACPMRMDAPITRINPIEVKSVNLVKSSSNLQSGLGGVIEVNREVPSENFRFIGNAAQMLGKSDETDFSMLAEKYNHRVSLRYVQGLPYKTGDNLTFQDLYGYKDSRKFRFAEASAYGLADNWKYTGSVMYSENISFPYLQMDEIKSMVYNLSASYRNYKIYFNYTDHVMNNSLRKSSMFMETDAVNFTLGFVSEFIEAYYRNWDADNRMYMLNGIMGIDNHILPDINLYSANFFRSANYYGFDFSGRLGLSYYNIADKNTVDFYRQIHSGAQDSRLFPLFGLSISKTQTFANSISVTGMLDVASEAPEAEALFVNVKRMMGKPYWSGNPSLDQPLRTTLRADFSLPYVSLNIYGSYIVNYVYLSSSKSGLQNYQTFGNVNALLLGLSIRLKYRFFESFISYTYGENESGDKPLIEILPLHITNRVSSPEFYGFRFYAEHTYENAQKRVDAGLSENTSSAWNKIDLGVVYSFKGITAEIDAENILNHSFSRHLSYVRDPFASGMRVIEPGLSFRLNLRYNY